MAYENMKIQHHTVDIAKVLYNSGVINEMDYPQAETLLNNTLASIPPVENQLRQAKNALSVLLGKTVGSVDNDLKQSKPIPVAPIQAAIGVPAESANTHNDSAWQKRKDADIEPPLGKALELKDTASEEPDNPVPSPSSLLDNEDVKSIFDDVVNETNNSIINIFILKVVDKEGNRHPELEDFIENEVAKKQDDSKQILRRRPDIRLAERKLAAQSALIGVAEVELYPHFSLLGSISLSASDAALTYATVGGITLGRLFDARSFQYSVGPSVSWNLFNDGRIKNQVRVEDARFQALSGVYQNTVLNAAKEAENALSGFVNAQKQRQELQKSYDSAKRSVELSLYQYQEGIVDYQRVLDSQRSLFNTQDALTRSNSEITINLINLYKAVGGGWEIRTEQDAVPESVKKQMTNRTDWGNLMKPKPLDIPEQDKSKEWRSPDW